MDGNPPTAAFLGSRCREFDFPILHWSIKGIEVMWYEVTMP